MLKFLQLYCRRVYSKPNGAFSRFQNIVKCKKETKKSYFRNSIDYANSSAINNSLNQVQSEQYPRSSYIVRSP